MDKRSYIYDNDDEEIITVEESSSPDAWIEPEMLRRCSGKYKTLSGELYEEQ